MHFTPEMIREVESLLGYIFVDKSRLIRALTRKAYAEEQRQCGRRCEDQETYRILGDAVLKLALTDLLVQHGYDSRAKINDKKKTLENRESLGKMPVALAIAPFIILGIGESKQQAHQTTSVIAETFEAVISAIYQDTGFETAKALINKWFGKFI